MEDFDNSTTSTDQGLIQVKPETSRDEQLAFIDTMREIQSGQNQEIQDTTHALGSDVTPEFGGINGTNSYWLSRYQIPQAESRIATLRTAAQSSALNTALNNYLTRLQEDYNKAYRRANKRARNRAKAAALAANSPKGNKDLLSPDTEENVGYRADGVVGFSPNNPGQPDHGTARGDNATLGGKPIQVVEDESGKVVWRGGNVDDAAGGVTFFDPNHDRGWNLFY